MKELKKHKKDSPEGIWEQKLCDDYYEHLWHWAVDPLYEKIKQWNEGKAKAYELDELVHSAQKKSQKIYNFFGDKRARVAVGIQLYDSEWFDKWLAENPAPPKIELVPRELRRL